VPTAATVPVGSLPDSVDVVVVGAGHNGLVCAAYLAAAGLEVLVLEARESIGGNTISEALTLPGFLHDSCSSAHVLIQSNPLLADDELGLLATHGLRYTFTDPAVVLPQADGDMLIMSRDLDGTVEEIARRSVPDALAFREMMSEWSNGLAGVHSRWSSGLPLGEDSTVRQYLDMRSRSAWEVVHQRFANPVVRSFMLWLSFATIQDPRRPGTGVLPTSIAAGRLNYGWATPQGGSGALPAALLRHLKAHGATVACNSRVARMQVEHGRVTAVLTDDGRQVKALRGVVSSAHLAQLAGMFDSADVPDDLAAARASWRPGLSVFAVHAALSRSLSYASSSGEVRSVAAGLGSAQGVADQLDAFARGEPDSRDPWLLVVNQALVDDSRAPAGSATLKLLTVAPYERADGRSWAETKDAFAESLVASVRRHSVGLDEANILALRAESPVDVAAHNPHNLGGSCHGGEFASPDGAVAAGWGSYRTSVDGLFLTGATSHPGGSVSGRPGRNAARCVLTDLGIDPLAVMSSR
jgi:phytoene dehydrogenase-like protein